MKPNEQIVTIPNGEAYGRVYATAYLSDQVPGSVLLAIIMTEQVKRSEESTYNNATGGYTVTKPEQLHTVPTYVFGVKHDGLTEQETELAELREEYAAVNKSRREHQQALYAATELKDKLEAQVKEMGERLAQREEALQVAAGAQQKLLTSNHAMERTLGKVRAHFGTEAFDKATGGGK